MQPPSDSPLFSLLAGRAAGILCHVTSVPGSGPVGNLGDARNFARWLSVAGVRVWQVLPLNPTDPATGNSPYSSHSAFALNPVLIDPFALEAEGLLQASGSGAEPSCGPWSDYTRAIERSSRAFEEAFGRFERLSPSHPLREDFERFRTEARWWLDDYCLYAVLKHEHENRSWTEWPAGLASREPDELERARKALDKQIRLKAFCQFLLQRQLEALRALLGELGILLFGDMPIYVSHDSADVWAHRHIFKLDGAGRPTVVAGVPPDYFSRTGQLWGNPVYDWQRCRQEGYAWWIARMRRALELFDMVRLDHFRGFAAYWEVKAGSRTAVNGQWQPGPGRELFDRMRESFGRLPLVAEDLGMIDEPVRRLMDELGLAGCRVLQFGFDDDDPENPHKPGNIGENCVAYTGTHDNDTSRGWYENHASKAARARLARALGHETSPERVGQDMCRLALGTKARLAVLPLQDVLGLGSEARMNTPGKASNNWRWRASTESLSAESASKVKEWCSATGRA